jgi:hypothetical protein
MDALTSVPDWLLPLAQMLLSVNKAGKIFRKDFVRGKLNFRSES